MKFRIQRVVLLGLLAGSLASVAISCEKDSFKPRPSFALKNGMDWSGWSAALDNKLVSGNTVDIHIDIANARGFRSERLEFYKIPYAVGKYILNNTPSSKDDGLFGAWHFTLLEHGDVSGDHYVLIDSLFENYLEVTSINGLDLDGTFQASFVKVNPDFPRDPSAPDTVIFTEGKLMTRHFVRD